MSDRRDGYVPAMVRADILEVFARFRSLVVPAAKDRFFSQDHVAERKGLERAGLLEIENGDLEEGERLRQYAQLYLDQLTFWVGEGMSILNNIVLLANAHPQGRQSEFPQPFEDPDAPGQFTQYHAQLRTYISQLRQDNAPAIAFFAACVAFHNSLSGQPRIEEFIRWMSLRARDSALR